MLFLAVFCSFIAEWQLEHSIEHSREKQFINSLVKDIKTDEENIEKLNLSYAKTLSHLDSLKDLLTSPDVSNNSYPAYYHWIRSFRFPDFVPNDGTTRQLLSSGGLRLIGKIQVVDSIMAYQQAIEHVRIQQQNLNIKLSYGSKQYELFDAMALRNGSMQTKIPLLSNDKRLLSWAYGEEEEWRNAISWLRVTTASVKSRGEGLRKSIKEQYGIE